MPFYFGQQSRGDKDNIALGGDVAVTIAPFARLYASLFIDEISFPPLSTFFTRADNQYAWQVGVKVPLPWLAWSLFVFQYTKIEPYTYTHYLADRPVLYRRPSTSITPTTGRTSATISLPTPTSSSSVCPPIPAPGSPVAVQYQLIRHGTGLLSLGQIEGDIKLPSIPAGGPIR